MCHRAQPDAVLEVVHLVEVVAPAAVDHAEHDASLQLAHGLLAERDLAALVRDAGVTENFLLEEGVRYPAARSCLGEHLIHRDGDRVDRLQLGPHGVEVPVVAVALGSVHLDDLGDDVVEEARDAILQVVTLEDVAAVRVDCLALAVQDVVVLEHVLADLRVAALHLRLRTADGPRDGLRLDRQVVGAVAH